MTDPTADEQQRRGYQEQTAWLQGKSIPEAQQALTEREATLGDDPYNEGGTRATREYIDRMCQAAGVRHIEIIHTRAEGTLVHGSAKGDGVYQILHALHGHWRPFRSLDCLGLVQSRDKAAKRYLIEQATAALITAGHVVTVSIDDTVARPFAEAEAERYDRAEGRVDYHTDKAGVNDGRAAAAWNAERGIRDMIPMGQPILVGHHSEGRHRRDLARADRHAERGLEAVGKADYHRGRAAAAEGFQAGREDIPTTLRRIERLEAEQARITRILAGRPDSRLGDDGEYHPCIVKPEGAELTRFTSELEAIREELAHWRGHVEQAKAAGAKVWSRDDFAKGDFVLFLGKWYEVLRVNSKSVTIPAMLNDGAVVTKANGRLDWTDTVPYHKVRAQKPAAEMAGILAEVERRVAAEAEAATAGG